MIGRFVVCAAFHVRASGESRHRFRRRPSPSYESCAHQKESRRMKPPTLADPPIRSWRHLPKAYLGVLFPAFMTAVPLAEMLTSPGSPRSDFLPPIIMHGTITLAIIAHALWRMRQRLVIDVTASHVAVAVVNP